MDHAPHILVVQERADLLALIRQQLASMAGYGVTGARSAAQALQALERSQPDLVLSELALPDMDGLEFARQVKASGDIPLLFLTALGEPGHEIESPQDLAEEIIRKPYDPLDLQMRIERVLRRRGLSVGQDPDPLRIDDGLTLDFAQGQALTRMGTVRLTDREVRLLRRLARSAGQPVPGVLLREVVGKERSASDVALRRAIFCLRQKLEPDPHKPRYVLAKPQSGYLLALPGSVALSEKQREILCRVARGQTDNEIAAQLGISSRTVGTHIQAIRSLLQASSRTHAVALAMSYGLLSGQDVQSRAPPGESS